MGSLATFGEKDWGEESAGGGKGKSDFFNMKDDGQYYVRIVGKPHEFATHWVESGSSKVRVNCAGRDCVLCKVKHKASVRYLIPVILRRGPGVSEPGTIAITEFGPQVYTAIRNLFNTADWGNPMTYDIMIDKNKKRGPSSVYFVTPLSKVPFTDSEKVNIKEFLETIRLKDFSSPMENSEIVEKLGPELCHTLGIKAVVQKPSADSTALDFGSDDSEYGFGT